ncbi:unnamed protein product [Paramecium pentaurelia]|uniref:Uncharacterized protein n=1 Tax=Paramecium pentaurelia TaxID=43138 RepID=A0A8S1VCI2_9CILI|nr:unnamed protein product [Paramecium pentaurelia]
MRQQIIKYIILIYSIIRIQIYQQAIPKQYLNKKYISRQWNIFLIGNQDELEKTKGQKVQSQSFE